MSIPVENMKRLLKDVAQMIKQPLTDNGIFYTHDEEMVTKGYAMIVGPADTPYFGGYYFFEFTFPTNYPFAPPKVTYKTNDGATRFNPNLYRCGKVCVSILNTWSGDQWSACQTIKSVLLTLCSLLNNAPLENEPGHTKTSNDFIPYQKAITYKNIEHSVCEQLINPKFIEPTFVHFRPIMVEKFMDNYDAIVAQIQQATTTTTAQATVETAHVSIYRMKVSLDYEALQKKMEQTRLQLIAASS